MPNECWGTRNPEVARTTRVREWDCDVKSDADSDSVVEFSFSFFRCIFREFDFYESLCLTTFSFG